MTYDLMEEYNYKEKALCAMLENPDMLSIGFHKKSIYGNFNTVGIIEVCKEKVSKLVKKEVVYRNWYGKRKSKIEKHEKFSHYKYTLYIVGKKYNIIEEDFNNVLNNIYKYRENKKIKTLEQYCTQK